MSSKFFSKMEIDAIGEILNISLGASATAVSTMLNARVDITTPIVNVVEKDEFKMDRVEPAIGVEITYVEGLEGKNVMLLKRHDVKVIVEMLMGMEMSDDEFELNEMNISAVCEIMNQMMGASSTALSEFLGRKVNISTPISFEVKNEQEFIDKYFMDNRPKVVVSFTLRIADRLESEFFNVMPIELAKGLVKGFLPESEIVDIDHVVEKEETESAVLKPQEGTAEATAPSSGGGTLSQEEIEKLLSGMEEEETPSSAASSQGSSKEQSVAAEYSSQPASAAEPSSQPAPAAEAAPQSGAAAAGTVSQPAAASAAAVSGVSPDMAMMQMQMMQQMMQQMQQMQQQLLEAKQAPEPKLIQTHAPSTPNLKQDKDIALDGEQEENMELIMGVPLEISVEIGRTKKLVKDILDFTKGSLVVLDKLAGEQVDLFVNGQCIAKGDVVVVEDNFGVRITEIMKVNLTTLE